LRNQTWDAILNTEAKKKYDISSGSLEHRKTKASNVIKTILNEEAFDQFTKTMRKKTSAKWAIIWKNSKYITSLQKFGKTSIPLAH
jgi:hypothetical protein